MDQWTFAFASFGCLTALSLLGLWAFRRGAKAGADGPPPRKRLLAWSYGGTCAGLYLLVVVEVLVGLFVSKSDGYGLTLAGRSWFAQHWHPTNSLGYRDSEPPAGEERILLVLGDSIAAGHGIADVQDRFPNRLASSLGSDWHVPVFAKPGWNLGEELAALEACTLHPERVLVEYSLTDIETAASECGLVRPAEIIAPPPKGLRTVIAHSHLLNWIYWRHIRSDFGDRYWQFMQTAYANPEVWQAHERLLLAMKRAAETKGATLYYTLWPDLSRVEESSRLLERVRQFLEAEGVPVLDLSEPFRSGTIQERTVNAMDDHPNEATHHEAARLILDWLSK